MPLVAITTTLSAGEHTDHAVERFCSPAHLDTKYGQRLPSFEVAAL